LHIALKLIEIARHFVFFFRHGPLLGGAGPLASVAAVLVLWIYAAAVSLAQAILEIFLLIEQALAAIGQVVNLGSGLLLAQPVHHALSFG